MSHPDLRRIHAHLDGRLEGAKRIDFERHLRECKACAEEHAELDRLRSISRRVVATAPVPEIDWDALEGRLLTRIAAAGTPRPKAPWWRVLVPAAVAAAIVVAVMTASQGPHTGVRPDRTVATAVVPDELRLQGREVHGVVTLLQGRVRFAARLGDTLRAMTISSPVNEGSSVKTGAASRVVVQTAPNTGFQVSPASTVEVLALRDTGAVLRLEEGTVGNQVQRLDASQAYRVVSGNLLIEVRGTRFDVTRAGRVTTVSVTEGVVAVRKLGRAREEEVLLHAPAQARFGEDAALASAARSEPPDLLPLWLKAARGAFAALRLPALPDVSHFDVGGINVGAGGSLLRHPRGTAQVVIYPLQGDPIHTEVALDRSTVSFRMPEARPEAPASRPAVGRADREAISRAMASYGPQVRRCYDRRLKRMPTLRERIELRITIGTDGLVSNAVIRGAGHDAEVSDCVLTVARRWTFQAPQGGPVTVSVPFNFAPRGQTPDGGVQ